MAKSTNPPKPATKPPRRTAARKPNHHPEPDHKPPSWAVMKSILTCKHLQIEQPSPKPQNKKPKCSVSLCSTAGALRPDPPELRRKLSSSSSAAAAGSSRSLGSSGGSALFSASSVSSSSAASVGVSQNALAGGGAQKAAAKGRPLRRLSGCYECRMVVDPSLRATICSCSECGEIFMKAEQLEIHQAIRHAVSELGPEDTSRNIVEIIFQSSWLRKQAPVCKIDRILKVHNTNRTVSRFEEYRDSIKSRATGLAKKHPRCVADGNELLRFHCTTLTCSLGLKRSTNLCSSIPTCNVCSIIRDGFKCDGERGVLTTATSGRAHDLAEIGGPGGDQRGTDEPRRAMLVCRVIAGRVRRGEPEVGDAGGGAGGGGGSPEHDSVAEVGGVYSNLDELYVHNPKAILPCFVVIYRGF